MSRRLGGAWALDGLWRVGIDTTIVKLAGGRRLDATLIERVLFALVANRALEPSSKLAATRWVAERVFVAGLGEVSDDACHRAMDRLLGIEADLATAVYWSVVGDRPKRKRRCPARARYHRVAGNLEVKGVVIDDGVRDRFVICRNPDEARRDAIVRDRLVAQLEEAITGTDKLPADNGPRSPKRTPHGAPAATAARPATPSYPERTAPARAAAPPPNYSTPSPTSTTT